LFHLFLLAFAVRLLFSLAMTLNHGDFYPDETFYYQQGVRIAETLRFPYLHQMGQLVRYVGSANIAYPVINAYHTLLYPDPFLCKITNSFLGAMVLLPVYCLAERLFSRQVALSSVVIVTFWPNLVYWSAVNLKETLVGFLIVSSMLCYHRSCFSRVALLDAGMLGFSIAALMALRIYVGVLLVSLIIVHFTVLLRPVSGLRRVGGIVLLLLLVPAIGKTTHVVAVLDSAMGLKEIQRLSEQSFSAAARHGYSMGRFDPQDPIAVPLSAAHFLFTPSPLRITCDGVADLLKVSNLFWYVMFPFCVAGGYNLCKSDFQGAFLIIFLVLGLVLFYSLFPFLGGVRHRDQVTPLLIMLSIFGYCGRLRHKQALVWSIWVALSVAILSFDIKHYFDLF
jgi:4-amino-4-deoxy-L-arabinose transferase-like glycosyltransferase